MLFLQIVATITLVLMAIVAGYALFSGRRPAEIRQNQVTVVIGNLIKAEFRDTYCIGVEYRAANTPRDMASPTVILRRHFDGEVDIQLGQTSGQTRIPNFGRHKIALLEEVLPDIKGQLVDKKA